MSHARRLLIVSNRLPVTARVDEQGQGIALTPTSGGLATGLRALHESRDSVWIGWPGDLSTLPRKQRDEVDAQLREQQIVPVQLRRGESQAFYDGVCNSLLWPLFHYAIDRLPLDDAPWQVYRQINERFADAVVAEYRRGDLIWVHDYHLLLVPGMLRARLPDADIGFFLHVPFPAIDVFRILPWRREVLEGLLGASLVGFHTETYASHFRDAVLSLTALEVNRGAIVANEHPVRVGAYPMGVDARWFARMAADEAVEREVAALRITHPRRLMVGVDRLDYTKGIPRRLLAFEQLLTDRPDLRGEVQLLQIAVPSRGDTPCYQQFRQQVEELVGRINGTLGTTSWTPIRYLHQSVSSTQLVALYRAADVMLVTPIRDGMNLVAKEFIAARTDDDGVLLLSEFAGASTELPEAVSVNPYAVHETAATMAQALSMPLSERRRRMQALRRRVSARDVGWWVTTFLRDLESVEQLGREHRSAGAPRFHVVGSAHPRIPHLDVRNRAGRLASRS